MGCITSGIFNPDFSLHLSKCSFKWTLQSTTLNKAREKYPCEFSALAFHTPGHCVSIYTVRYRYRWCYSFCARPCCSLCFQKKSTLLSSVHFFSAAQKAFLRLGYEKCYHYWQWIEHPDHSATWKRAYEAKYLNKAPFTRNDWDEILGEYQVNDSLILNHVLRYLDSLQSSCYDLQTGCYRHPCVYLAAELIAAYLEAKVVFQTRDLKSWYDSIHNTIVKFCRGPTFYYLCGLDPGMKQW